MAAPTIKSKRYGGSQTAPANDKDDAAIADYRGSAVKAIKRSRGGSTKKRPVSGRSVRGIGNKSAKQFGKKGL